MTVLMFKWIYRYHLHVVVGFRTPHLSLIHVNDLVQIILRAAESGERVEATTDGAYSPQGYYFACDDSEYPNYWELGKRLAVALNRRVFVWPLWRWVGRTVAGVHQLGCYLRGQSSPVNVDKIREATVSSWACSCEKARRQLAFNPSANLDSWFKRTADWYIDNGWL